MPTTQPSLLEAANYSKILLYCVWANLPCLTLDDEEKLCTIIVVHGLIDSTTAGTVLDYDLYNTEKAFALELAWEGYFI